MIWFPQAIRRHAFIVWLAIQDRLATQDKLLKWGLTNSVSCVFCRARVEDRNHLFFGCHFIAGIWLGAVRFSFVFSSSRCSYFACPGLWDLFTWLLVSVVPSMWVFGLCFIRWFLFRAEALFLCFKGGAVRFSFFLGAFLASCVFFFCWALPFW